MQSAAVEKTLKERIAEATLASLHNRDLYTEQTVDRVVDVLRSGEKEVKATLLHYANLGSLPEGKAINQKSLRKSIVSGALFVDDAGQISRPEPVVDIYDGNPGRTAVQHR